MRKRRHKLEVSTFPFLAVLLCAMGSLILLLLVIDRRAQAVAKAKAMQAAQKAEVEDARVAEARAAEIDRRRKELHARLLGQNTELLQKLQHAQGEANALALNIAQISRNSEAMRSKIQIEAAKVSEKKSTLAARRQSLGHQTQVGESARKEMERITAELQQLEYTLSALKMLKQREKQMYSVIPYRGKRGDSRMPLYVECTANALVFHPERKSLENASIASADVRAEVERRIERQKAKTPGATENQDENAYLLMLIRPDGINTYYQTIAALNGVKVEFGYELIESDWVLDFPMDDAAPARQPWMASANPITPSADSTAHKEQRTNTNAGQRQPGVATQSGMIGVSQSAADNSGTQVSGQSRLQHGSPTSGPSSANVAGGLDHGSPPDGTQGVTNGPALRSNSQHLGPDARDPLGRPVGYGGNRGGGSESGFSAYGAANIAGGNAGVQTSGNVHSGSIGMQGTTSAAGPAIPGTQGGTLASGAAGGHPGADPARATAQDSGNAVAGHGVSFSGVNGAGAGTGGGGESNYGNPGSVSVQESGLSKTSSPRDSSTSGPLGQGNGPDTESMSATPNSGAAAALGPPSGPAGAAAANAGGKSVGNSNQVQISASDTTANAANTSGQTASAGPGTSARGASNARNGVRSGSAQGASEGDEGEPAGDGRPNPLSRLVPQMLQRKTARPGPVKPRWTNVNRDWPIPIDCQADGVMIRNNLQRISLDDLKRPAENPLLISLQQMIARRQARLQDDEPPYRPLIRFYVHGGGLRAYYLAYPILSALSIPMTREDLDPDEEVRSERYGKQR